MCRLALAHGACPMCGRLLSLGRWRAVPAGGVGRRNARGRPARRATTSADNGCTNTRSARDPVPPPTRSDGNTRTHPLPSPDVSNVSTQVGNRRVVPRLVSARMKAKTFWPVEAEDARTTRSHKGKVRIPPPWQHCFAPLALLARFGFGWGSMAPSQRLAGSFS